MYIPHGKVCSSAVGFSCAKTAFTTYNNVYTHKHTYIYIRARTEVGLNNLRATTLSRPRAGAAEIYVKSSRH